MRININLPFLEAFRYVFYPRYGDVLALLGRELRDFLNGLDNLHEYLKFSYPRFQRRIVIKNGLFSYFF